MITDKLTPQGTPVIWKGRYDYARESGLSHDQAVEAADLAILNLDNEVNIVTAQPDDDGMDHPLP